MSDTETKTRHHIEADGIIRPDDVCTIKGAKKIWGLSRGQLDDARSSGFVKAQKDAKNIKALYCLAAAVLSDHHCYHDGPSRLLIADKDFSLVFSALTKTIGGVE